MPKRGYVGVDQTARRGKRLYTGIDNVARKVKAAYVGVDGVARKWWPSGIFDREMGFQVAGSGWNGYATAGAPYRDWQSAMLGGWTDRPKARWTITAIGDFDLEKLPLIPGTNYATAAQGVRSGGTIGPLPPTTFYYYYSMYNSDSSHRHQLWIKGESGTTYVQKYWTAKGTGTWSETITIDEPHYVWHEYWTDDGWASEGGSATFQYICKE